MLSIRSVFSAPLKAMARRAAAKVAVAQAQHLQQLLRLAVTAANRQQLRQLRRQALCLPEPALLLLALQGRRQQLHQQRLAPTTGHRKSTASSKRTARR
jgi:hypothetical protein